MWAACGAFDPCSSNTLRWRGLRTRRAIGVQGAAQAIGLSVGPSLGDFLIDAFDWRAVFFIAVPFGLAGTLLGWFLLPQTPPRDVQLAAGSAERFDWPGALLLGPGVALALFAVTFANGWGWASPRTLLPVAFAAAALGVFWAAERRAAFHMSLLFLAALALISAGLSAARCAVFPESSTSHEARTAAIRESGGL